MDMYRYTAMNPARERVQGEVKAKDAESGIKSLQSEGLTVITFQAVSAAAQNKEEVLTERLLLLFDRIRYGVPLTNLVFFTRQLATMFSAGMTLERALNVLSRGERHPKFRQILVSVHGDLKKGQSLSDALGRHPAIFNRLYIALIKSGEVGGTLGRILDELALHLEKSEDVRRKVASALYYPVFVLCFLALSVAVLVLKVAPMFNKVYKSFGADLPAPTLALMNTSNFILAHFISSFLLLLLIVAGFIVFSMTPTGRLWLDTVRFRMPVLGRLVRNAQFARFSRTLALLVSSSVPMLDALVLTAQATTNLIVEKGIWAARQKIMQGRKINLALEETAVFPPLLIQLVATGEETGEIDKLLAKSSEFYEKEVEAIISKMTSILEPLLIVLMGSVVGALVVIIYLPIFYLGSAIRKGMQ